LILESSVEYCRMITDKLLAETNLTLDDIDFFITSDQSTKIWEAQVKELEFPLKEPESVLQVRQYGCGNESVDSS